MWLIHCMNSPIKLIDIDGVQAADPSTVNLLEVSIIGQKVMKSVSRFWDTLKYYLLGRTFTLPVCGIDWNNVQSTNPIGYITYNVDRVGVATDIAPQSGIGPTPAKTGLNVKEVVKLFKRVG